MNKIHVIYHHPCPDGCMAAAVCLYQLGSENVVLHPLNYKQPVPEIPEGVKLYIVDFSLPKAELEALAETRDVLVLDHHKTAAADLGDLKHPDSEFMRAGYAYEGPRLRAIFDQSRSGAGLVWDFLTVNKPRPQLVACVEDRDLWAWKQPNSKAIGTWLQAKKLDPRLYLTFLVREMTEEGFWENAVADGELLLGQEQSFVRRLAQNVFWKSIEGYRVPVVNSGILQSEIGAYLVETYPEAPFSAVFYETQSEKYPGHSEKRYSLRSNAKGNNFDVSEVAKGLGGGGHRNAAGFVVL